MITLHHLDNSRSQRILWLLEELELPYEIKFYKRNPKTKLAPSELLKIHPLGKSPVITDGKNTMAESGAIIEYLLDTHAGGKLRPAPQTQEKHKFTYWLHYAEGSAMPPLLMSLIFSMIPRQPMPFFVKPIARGICEKVKTSFVNPQIENHLNFMESELEKTVWFAGSDFTAADIQMSFVVEAAAARGALGARPKLKDFLKRIHARPAYQKAVEKGGAFDLLS